MTKSYLSLKKCPHMADKKGQLVLVNGTEENIKEMAKLIEDGFFREISEQEALTIYHKQND